jgi:hypothetical protein
MRLEARLAIVVPTLLILAVALWPGDRARPVAPPVVGATRARTAEPIERATPPRPMPRRPAPATETGPPDGASEGQEAEPRDRGPRPGIRTPPTRSRSYDAVLIAAHLAPASIGLDELRRFWAEAADRGAPREAIAALLRIARANEERPDIAHAALDQREDLVALRARTAEATASRSAGAGPTERLEPEEMALAAQRPRTADRVDAESALDDDAHDALAHVLRYGSDRAEASRAIERVGLVRSERATRTLLLAAEHPGPDQRLAAVTALWRAAADDPAQASRVRDALDRARFDGDRRIAARAERALRDLEVAGAPAIPDPARAGDNAADAGGCPIELCPQPLPNP